MTIAQLKKGFRERFDDDCSIFAIETNYGIDFHFDYGDHMELIARYEYFCLEFTLTTPLGMGFINFIVNTCNTYVMLNVVEGKL